MPLFKDLNYYQLSLVAAVAKIDTFNKDEIIIKKNDTGDTFYIILEGQVHCSDAMLLPIHRASDPRLKGDHSTAHLSAAAAGSVSQAAMRRPSGHKSRKSIDLGLIVEGNEVDRRTASDTSNSADKAQDVQDVGVKLKAGEWFGEIALLTGCVRTANVIADTPVRLATFDRHAFEKVLGNLKDIIDKEFNNRMLSNLELIASLPPERVSVGLTLNSLSLSISLQLFLYFALCRFCSLLHASSWFLLLS
jgi:CRP-like cAMP-binding protein